MYPEALQAATEAVQKNQAAQGKPSFYFDRIPRSGKPANLLSNDDIRTILRHYPKPL
jgi:hypothetical protein